MPKAMNIMESNPGKVLFLQGMLAEIWVEKVLACTFCVPEVSAAKME